MRRGAAAAHGQRAALLSRLRRLEAVQPPAFREHEVRVAPDGAILRPRAQAARHGNLAERALCRFLRAHQPLRLQSAAWRVSGALGAQFRRRLLRPRRTCGGSCGCGAVMVRLRRGGSGGSVGRVAPAVAGAACRPAAATSSSWSRLAQLSLRGVPASLPSPRREDAALPLGDPFLPLSRRAIATAAAAPRKAPDLRGLRVSRGRPRRGPQRSAAERWGGAAAVDSAHSRR